MKKTLLATLLVFIYIFVFEWLFHGVILGERYMATAHLWRPEAEMMARMGWMVAGQLLMAVFLTQIFNLLESGFLRMGALLGALYGSGSLVMYSVAPYPLDLTIIWIIGGIVEYMLAGLVYGLVASLVARKSA